MSCWVPQCLRPPSYPRPHGTSSLGLCSSSLSPLESLGYFGKASQWRPNRIMWGPQPCKDSECSRGWEDLICPSEKETAGTESCWPTSHAGRVVRRAGPLRGGFLGRRLPDISHLCPSTCLRLLHISTSHFQDGWVVFFNFGLPPLHYFKHLAICTQTSRIRKYFTKVLNKKILYERQRFTCPPYSVSSCFISVSKLRGKFTKLAFYILDDNIEQKTDNVKKIKQTKTLKG